jgi:hypothetical protein
MFCALNSKYRILQYSSKVCYARKFGMFTLAYYAVFGELELSVLAVEMLGLVD